METIKLTRKSLKKAVEILKNGGVIICPTDTVYGFLADAQNKKAVDKIFKIKKRPKSKPLPVFFKDIKMAIKIVDVSKEQEKVLSKFWPGKYTFVLKRNIDVGRLSNSGSTLYGVNNKTIAIRIPKHKFLNNLLKKINRPLVQTSVNISGQESFKKIRDIIENFKGDLRVDLTINGGNLLKSKPSRIVDLSKGKIKTLRK